MGIILKTFAVVAGLVLLSQPVLASEFNDKQKADIEEIVRGYLLEHPEIITEMSQKLEQQQKLAEDKARGNALRANADMVFRHSGDASVGGNDTDITVVEFMDYNCGWCKRGVGEVSSLIKSDPKIKVVFKEFPIFGEGSEYAAKAALASAKQGKYWELHQALFAQEGHVDIATVDDVAKSIGIDVEKMKSDMNDAAIQATIDDNRQLAQALLIGGTPAFIIDDKLVPGYIPGSQIATIIQSVRESGGCKLC